jgi:sugar phosphate isomerase/epimerase
LTFEQTNVFLLPMNGPILQKTSPLQFTRRSAARVISAATLLAATPAAWCATPPSIGVQLYTLRGELATDLPGTLAAVRKIGIEQVESFPALYARPAAELKSLFQSSGLTCPSGHFDYDKLEVSLDYAKALGLTYVVCSALPAAMRNPEGFARAAERFNIVGAKAKKMGMRLAFHNHNFEFLVPAPDPARPEDKPPAMGLTTLLQETDPQLVSWEEDCYWVAQSGNDPLEFLKRYQQRVKLLHLKDRLPNAPVTFVQGKQSQFFTEVGTGTIAWPPILQVARKTGALLFIEQDVTAIPPLESLAISYRNLRAYQM